VKRTLVAVALALIFMLALAAPALAMFHSATVTMDGTIDFKSQAGHKCNTGAEFKQVIAGSGTLDKAMTVLMKPGIITVNDRNDWVAGATPLTVTSVWELCTPPKYTYDGTDEAGQEITAPVSVESIYGVDSIPASFTATLSGVTPEMLADRYGWEALTGQIWAVQVQANPGFSGYLSQKGEAAYGPFWTGDHAAEASWNRVHVPNRVLVNESDTWRWEGGDAVSGADYVGDYFTMEQHARTSQGTLRRYIDLSSPWTHAYVHEDMSVVGKSDIKDAIEMNNLPAGADVPKDWWRLF